MNSSWNIVIGMFVVAVGLWGCSRTPSTVDSKVRAEQLQRLTERVEALEAELSAVRTAQEAEFAAVVRDVLRDRVAAMVASNVEAGVGRRLGDSARASQVLRSVVQDQVTAYLKQEEMRVAAEREERRREEEQRRRERENAALVRFAQELGLNNEQTGRLVDLSDRARQRIRELMGGTQTSAGAVDVPRLREQAQALRAEVEAELSQILSPDQLAQLNSRREFGVLRFLEQLAQGPRGEGGARSSTETSGIGAAAPQPPSAR